jgi:hypothetical protein
MAMIHKCPLPEYNFTWDYNKVRTRQFYLDFPMAADDIILREDLLQWLNEKEAKWEAVQIFTASSLNERYQSDHYLMFEDEMIAIEYKLIWL